MSVNRFDTIKIDDLLEKATIREDGSLTARAIITSIGVFPYKNKQGRIDYELREPSAVFDEAFLETVKNLPIYVGHKANPDGTLIKDTAKMDELAVGRTGSNPIGDNVFLATDVTITRQDGIDAIKSGVRSFSVGYTCDTIDESGVWCGAPYNKKQVNLRGNHLSLVPVGRQGDQAVLRMDSDDAILCEDATVVVAKDMKPNKGEEMADNMKVVKIDSVDYQAEAPVIVALNQTQLKLDTAEQNLKAATDAKSTVEAERDSFKARMDAAEAKVKELEVAKLDEAVISARVAEKIALLDAAKKANVEVKADASDLDIKKAIIMGVFPDAKLDGRDDVYINARLDCAYEEQARREVADADASVRIAGSSSVVKADSAEDVVETARKRMLDRLNGKK